METRIAELRYKEVISVTDGSRFGYVGDMEVDLESGQVRALVVPGRLRLFGLLGREEDRLYPLGPGAAVWGGHHPGGAGAPASGHCAAAGERGAEQARPAQVTDRRAFPYEGNKKGEVSEQDPHRSSVRIWATSARVAVPAGSR